MDELEAEEDYKAALADLTQNSKPHINMLTMLADEKKQFASNIVRIVETRIHQVQNNQKLPLLYLIDSIVKNCDGSPYKELFAKNLITTFLHVFEKGDEKTRAAMFKLRQTWPLIFPGSKLYGIDIKVHSIDRAWPLVDPPKPASSSNKQGTSIHVNPKFLTPNAPPKTIVPQQESSPKIETKSVRLQQQPNAAQIELQNFDDVRRIQKEAQPTIARSTPAPQSFENALGSGTSSRDPRIRSAVQKRGGQFDSSPVEEDCRPVINQNPTVSKPSDRNYVKKLTTKPTEKKLEEKPTSKPMSVVTKVTPSVRVLAEPGRWSFKEDSSKNPSLPDVKIAKLPPNRIENSKKIDVYHSPVVDREKRNDFSASPLSYGTKNQRGRGAGVDRYRGGRGRGGGQHSYVSSETYESTRKSNANSNFPDRRQFTDVPKRDRSPSPMDESPAKAKRDRIQGKSRRDEEISPGKDRDERVSPRKNVKDSPGSNKTKADVRQTQQKSSFVAASAADTDMRNNSTDSDRSGREITLPLKKRKRSDEGSTSAEGFPLDQVLPKEETKTKKLKTKSEDYLDELLFGSGEDTDIRKPPRFTQQNPKSNRKDVSKPVSSSSTLNDRTAQRPSTSFPTRISVDAPILPDESVDTLVEYRANIIQRAEQQMTDGSLSPQAYKDIVRDMSRLSDHPPLGAQQKAAPKRQQAPTHARKPKLSNFANTRPKMRPIPKTTSQSFVRPSNSTPVFQNPSTIRNNSDRQSMLPQHTRPMMNYNAVGGRLPIDMTLNQSIAEPIPVNNRIYVDGISYEVKYVDDVPVIERNGLPHRMRFIGAGRDIVIDDIAYSLKFDETKDILIDGQMHKIRFGGPSRELYMGNYPFRGSFGGPPIFATINGVKHKILLCGPPPEVKIDPEPSMDLVRYAPPPIQGSSSAAPMMPPYYAPRSSTTTSGHPSLLPTPSMNVPPPPLPTSALLIAPPMFPSATSQAPPPVVTDVDDLLARLLNNGIIVPPTSVVVKPAQEPPKAIAPMELGTGVMRTGREPPLNLKEFNISVLKIRFAPIVNSLYQERIQCSTCGMRFIDGDQQKYSKHLDWHFKQNRLEKLPGRSMSRPWYFAAEDWINFEEFADDNAPKAKSAVFENAQSQSEDTFRFLVASTDSVILATRDEHNECAVCHEKFEQFWDEDEEAWKLRNATLVDDKAYHPLCYQDVSNVERDFCSPGFGSPATDKPVFWACDPILVPEPPPTTNVEPLKSMKAELDDDDVDVSSTLMSVLPSFLTEQLQKSSTPSDERTVKRNESSQDLLQSVLSVVSNVPPGLLVNNLTAPFNVNFDVKSSSSSIDDVDTGSAASVDVLCVNNANNFVNFFDNNSYHPNDDHKPSSSATSSSTTVTSPLPTSSPQLFVDVPKILSSSDGGSSCGTTPLRDEFPESPGTPVHDEMT